MSFDRPRTTGSPRIDPQDPLPVNPLTGRWGDSFQSDGDRLWHRYLRRHLTRVEEQASLLYHVSAPSRDELDRITATQDEKAAEIGSPVPAWRERGVF